MAAMELDPRKRISTGVTTPSVTPSQTPAAQPAPDALSSLQSGTSLLTLFDTEPTTPMTPEAFKGKFGAQPMKIGLIKMTMEEVS
jgi:hypothetical protein